MLSIVKRGLLSVKKQIFVFAKVYEEFETVNYVYYKHNQLKFY